MKNEVLIHVRAVNDTKAVFDLIRAEAHNLGDTVGINVNKTVTQRLENDARAAAGSGGGYARAGDAIGKTMGDRISQRITEKINVKVDERLRDSRGRFIGSGGGTDREHVSVRDRETVHVDVDVNKQSLLQRLASFGKEAGEKFSGFFQDGFKTVAGGIFSGDIISTIFKGLSVAGIVAVLAPVLSAGISAAMMTALGGGVVALGIVGALKDPRIKLAVNDLKKELQDEFKGFSDNFRPALENFFASPNKSQTGGRTGILGVLDQIKPQIEALGQTFGKLTDKLLNQGLVGMLQNLLPGALRAMQGATPFINTLADELPDIGEAIGKVFDIINSNSAGSQVFWKDFLNALEKIIPLIGAIIGGLSNMYLSIRLFFAKMRVAAWEWAGGFINAADMALGWIPGLGAKFAAARKKVHQFANDANRDLQNIKDVQVTVTLKTVFGHAWSEINKITGALQSIGAVKKVGHSNNSGMGGHSYGGVVGMAAAGGSRSGLTLVGERGPELIDAAPGSQVYSNADSMRMLGGGGGIGSIVVPIYLDGREIARAMAGPMRDMVRNSHGGSVQAAYGS